MLNLAPRLQALNKLFVAEETISVIRHDLRNKLGSIRNANYYLRRKVQSAAPALVEEDPRVPRLFQMIEEETELASQMLASKLPSVVDALASKPAFDVSEFVRNVVAALPVDPGCKVEVVAGSPVLAVQADPNELELAVCCLLENALELLSPLGGGVVTVRCYEREKGHAAVEITDNGPPLTTEQVQKAMTPFYSTKPGRLGLGLNIAKRVAARWGGRLEFHPGDAGGAVAIVQLPLASPQAALSEPPPMARSTEPTGPR
ncbi:MAG: HAMP domain-containing sensor histidine kinase [Myxococcota bacterium]